MRHAVSSELFAYWRALKKAGSPPERNAIEPGAIRAVLADTFVLDFDPAGGFPFRIAGSRVNALFLRELRGAAFLQIWRDADRGAIKSILQTVADHEAPCLIVAEARPPGLAPVELEVALLPLRHQGATHARVLGSLAVGLGSDWLGLIGSGPAAFKACRPLESDASEPQQATAPVRLGRLRGASRQVQRA